MIFEGEDTWGDCYKIDVDGGQVYLDLYDSCVKSLPGGKATHSYTPDKARKLAKRLKKAAKLAETESFATAAI